MKIQINDQELGLQWGLGAIENYCDAMDCDVIDLDRIFIPNEADKKPYLTQHKAIVQLVLSGLQNHAELHDQKIEVTRAHVQSYLDEHGMEEITTDFLSSKLFGKSVRNHLFGEEVPEEDSKKKLVSAE